MRLLVVDDEPELGALVRSALERAGFAVDLAADLQTAASCLDLVPYDAAVLDLSLPDGDGLDLLRRLRARRSALPVLLLTARDAPEERVLGLDTGADDYLVKPFHMDELISRVRALLRRPNAALGVDLRLANLAFHTTSREVTVDAALVPLTPREASLLELLLRRQGSVVPRESLEDGLYGFDNPTSPNAVEVLVHRLRRRLQDAEAAVIVHTIRGVGYLLAKA